MWLENVNWKSFYQNVKSHFIDFVIGMGGWIAFLIILTLIILILGEFGAWLAAFLFFVFIIDSMGKKIRKKM